MPDEVAAALTDAGWREPWRSTQPHLFRLWWCPRDTMSVLATRRNYVVRDWPVKQMWKFDAADLLSWLALWKQNERNER